MTRNTRTPEALSDVLAIEAHLTAFDPTAARRPAVESVVAADGLATSSEPGRLGLEDGTQELAAVRPYPVVYRAEADDERVWISRVLHGARHRRPGGTL